MPAILALVAALMFALGTVIQQRVAMTVSDDDAMSAGFLIRLAKRPAWLAGIAAGAVGFAAQAVALGIGRIIVVQPLLASAVVFALPLGAKLTGQRIDRRDIVAALAVTAGLGAFLVIADPSGGRDDGPIRTWLLLGGAICALSAILTFVGRQAAPRIKAATFGTAAGLLFGLSAALTKAVVDSLGDGLGALLTDWHLYALITVGFVGMTIAQISLQTGALAPAAATQMIFDPIASVILAILLLDEKIHDTPLGIVGSLLALAVVCAGLVALSTRESGAVRDDGEPEPAPAPA